MSLLSVSSARRDALVSTPGCSSLGVAQTEGWLQMAPLGHYSHWGELECRNAPATSLTCLLLLGRNFLGANSRWLVAISTLTCSSIKHR